MKFDEHGFRHLVDETEATIMRLGTTSHVVLDRHKRFTKMLVEHLKTLDQPFELTHCLEWVNSLEHDPASMPLVLRRCPARRQRAVRRYLRHRGQAALRDM